MKPVCRFDYFNITLKRMPIEYKGVFKGFH